MRAGIAIKPGTDVSVLYDIFDNSNMDEVPEVRLDDSVSFNHCRV